MDEYENYLAHHGIKGQKWGVRRFQNPDGSWTAEGRKRYGASRIRNRVKSAVNQTKQKIQKVKERRRQREEAEYEQEHEKLVSRLERHPKQVYRNRDKLTNEDIERIMKRVEFDKKCRTITKGDSDSFFTTLRKTSDNIGTVSNLIGNSTRMYNNTAEVFNSFIDFGLVKDPNIKKWPKIGGGKPPEDRTKWERIVRSGTAQDILNNIGNLTPSELNDAMKRLNYEQQLRDKIKPAGSNP